MTSANGGNYARQYPCDGWVDNYKLEPTASIGRTPKLVPSSIDNRWRVYADQYAYRTISTKSSDATTLVACAPSPSCFGKNVSEPCLILEERLCTGVRDLHAPLENTV